MMAVTIFVSAFLLFQVQPLISKQILPWFGGSPAVWTTAMLFFQSVLFGGYAYAHFATRYLSAKTHLRIHIGLVFVAALMASLITPSTALKPNGDENPMLYVLLLLSICVGLPYFTLASTGPIVQAWFSRIRPGASPYRLYSLSNVGSYLALLTFPYLFEPLLELPDLGRAWTLLFWFFAVSCILTAVVIMNLLPNRTESGIINKNDLMQESTRNPAPSILERSAWIGLPALASLTMIAATDHVSHHVAPEPRLWITTLGLYLLTFIITFDHERWYRRSIAAAFCLCAIAFLTGYSEMFDWLRLDWSLGDFELRWSHFVVMFLICFLCHGELVRLRPKSTDYLTEFYMCVSAGGACGGLFASIVAVNMFNGYFEWTLCLILALVACCWILVFTSGWRQYIAKETIHRSRLSLMCCCTVASFTWIFYFEDPWEWRSTDSGTYISKRIETSRNFYGVVSVEDQVHQSDPSRSYRGFYSGNVIHGMQLKSAEARLRPVSYYGAGSGIADTIKYAQARQEAVRIAVIGLGAGSVASYGRPTDHFDFYEINPEVIRIAETYFTFLSGSHATTQVILGDGRLKLDANKDAPYDIIMLDAFTGGTVPVHLLTKEAFGAYKAHLAPNGFIVAHITNSHLNLYPIAKLQAEHLGMGYRSKYESYDENSFVRRNFYMTMTEDRSFLSEYPTIFPPVLDKDDNIIGRKELDLPGVSLWTDHFSSINRITLDD